MTNKSGPGFHLIAFRAYDKGAPKTPIRIAFVKGPDNQTIELFQNEDL